MFGNRSGREPPDPVAAGMRQLALMALVFVTAAVGAVKAGAGPIVIGLVALWALASTVLAVIFGIRRGDQVNRQSGSTADEETGPARPDVPDL